MAKSWVVFWDWDGDVDGDVDDDNVDVDCLENDAFLLRAADSSEAHRPRERGWAFSFMVSQAGDEERDMES